MFLRKKNENFLRIAHSQKVHYVMFGPLAVKNRSACILWKNMTLWHCGWIWFSYCS